MAYITWLHHCPRLLLRPLSYHHNTSPSTSTNWICVRITTTGLTLYFYWFSSITAIHQKTLSTNWTLLWIRSQAPSRKISLPHSQGNPLLLVNLWDIIDLIKYRNGIHKYSKSSLTSKPRYTCFRSKLPFITKTNYCKTP